MASFNPTIDRYGELLSEQDAGRLKLPNDNLDLGTFTAAGKNKLTDATYSQPQHKVQGHYTEMSPELRSDILAFYHERPRKSPRGRADTFLWQFRYPDIRAELSRHELSHLGRTANSTGAGQLCPW